MKKTFSMLLAAAVLLPGLAFAQEGAWQNVHQDNQAIRQNTENFYQDKNAAAGEEMQEQNDVAHGNILGAIIDDQQRREAKHDARTDAANISAAEAAKHHDIHELHRSEYDMARERQERADRERHEHEKEEARWRHEHEHDHDHDDWHHDHDHGYDHDHGNWDR